MKEKRKEIGDNFNTEVLDGDWQSRNLVSASILLDSLTHRKTNVGEN